MFTLAGEDRRMYLILPFFHVSDFSDDSGNDGKLNCCTSLEGLYSS